MLAAVTRLRLQRLADDCEERARRAGSPEARSLYNRTAADARRAAMLRGMGEDGLRTALEAAVSAARFAAYLDGDVFDTMPEPARDSPERNGDQQRLRCPATKQSRALESLRGPDARPSGDLLNARQLAARFGMCQRTALRTIERGNRRGLPGFYRDRSLWFAEPDAFKRFRAG